GRARLGAGEAGEGRGGRGVGRPLMGWPRDLGPHPPVVHADERGPPRPRDGLDLDRDPVRPPRQPVRPAAQKLPISPTTSRFRIVRTRRATIGEKSIGPSGGVTPPQSPRYQSVVS